MVGQGSSDLANQWSRFDRHVALAIGGSTTAIGEGSRGTVGGIARWIGPMRYRDRRYRRNAIGEHSGAGLICYVLYM